LVTPGNALCVQADKPFRALAKFGNDFMNKFQSSQLPVPILEDLTFIDTPGVLSGEKQRIGRTYDFVSVSEWFAERSDMILLLFDAHKLDISDEFKRTIEALKPHTDKIRVVLNKADMVNNQQLMRVYGALMWSLGKVMQTPEVMRVYIGSFWEQPYQNTDNTKLFDLERNDLLKDLMNLPRNAAVRKVNELVKRARLAKVHALLISHLRDQMPSLIGKGNKQQELIQNMSNQFFQVHKKYQLPPGDFPDVTRFKERLANYDFSKFAKLNPKLIENMDQVLADDIPKLMRQFPQEQMAHNTNPFDVPEDEQVEISEHEKVTYSELFNTLNPVDEKVAGKSVRTILTQSKLPTEILSRIWVLSDRDKDGALTREDFVIAMWLVNSCLGGKELPKILPPYLQNLSLAPPAQSLPSAATYFTPVVATSPPSTNPFF